MRAAPPIEVALDRHGLWQGFVGASALATGAVIATWIALGERSITSAVSVAAAIFVLAAAVTALSVAAPRHVCLRWTGLRWQLTDVQGASLEPADGDVHVAIDLGPWMLLRFVADPAHAGRVTWLPVQRRGLETRWHALRCAVYAPRPVSGLR